MTGSREDMGPHAPPPRAPRDPAVEALEQRLGLAITDDGVALAALTHKSYVNEHRGEALHDNERLEFLGDAVIDLAVSHRLMERFPEAREGELSKIRAAVVDEAGLALIARQLDLGPLLRLGRGEELTGGREKSSLLADAMEAVIAALYLGGGLEIVLSLLDRFLGEAFASAAAGTLDRDYKTQFQELAQSRLRAAPRYRVAAEHGPDHSKVFEVELELRGEVVGRGSGRSKKDAEQAAAKQALEATNGGALRTPTPVPTAAAPGPETREPGRPVAPPGQAAAPADAAAARPAEPPGAPAQAPVAAPDAARPAVPPEAEAPARPAPQRRTPRGSAPPRRAPRTPRAAAPRRPRPAARPSPRKPAQRRPRKPPKRT